MANQPLQSEPNVTPLSFWTIRHDGTAEPTTRLHNADMQDDEQKTRNLVSTWMSASKTGDVDTVLSLMADDAVFLVPGRPVMHKSDFAAAARDQVGPNAPQFDGSSDIQEIKVIRDWAFMWTKLAVIVTPSDGGRSVKREGYTLTILKKQDGKWVLARDANMLVPVPD